MSITRWAPFSAFTELERDMRNMLDRFTAPRWPEGLVWKPKTDLYRDGDELIVHIEVPGIEAADIDVHVDDNVLRITGEKKLEKEIKEEDHYLRECRYGSFRREVLLPEGIDTEKVAATFDKGVLTVTAPIPEEKEAETKTTVKIPVKETAKV